jgi:hypothetical protein
MWRTLRVDVDFQTGILVQKGAAGARMIEMDMREENGRQIGQSHARPIEAFLECGQCAGRTRVDERNATGTVHDDGRNDTRLTLELEIDI